MSPPPPRRSARLKRRAQSAPETTATTVEVPTTTVEAPTTTIATRSSREPKRSKTRDVASAPSETVPVSTYQPSKNTLFLREDLESIRGDPLDCPTSKRHNLAANLRAFNNNVHDYFCSVRAGKSAAAEPAACSMYRHIGHVVIEGFRADPSSVIRAKRLGKHVVNLWHSIWLAEAEDDDLLNALHSLSWPNQQPYVAPCAVLVADGPDYFACTPENGKSLVAHVYIGRLAFEMIAFDEMKTVFSALKPSVSSSPLPKMREYPAKFGRSPGSDDDRFTLGGVLRRAESVGYAELSERQRGNVEKHLTVKLYSFQEQTVRWMADKEDDVHCINDYFWEERSFTGDNDGGGGCFYYFPQAGDLRLRKPPITRGGMVTEEMGLGKTVEALALIAAQKVPKCAVELDVYCETRPQMAQGLVSAPRLRQKNEDAYAKQQPCALHHGDEILCGDVEAPYPQTFRVRRYPPHTTLVVCPNSLLAQWLEEAASRAPGLSVAVWKSPSRTDAGSTTSIAVGKDAKDIVVVSYQTLTKDSLISKISWKRLILDEAQVTRRSTAQVAKDTFNLRADVRFLMTGTPFVKSLDDLQGELAFLKIWPFTLTQDGFWDYRVMIPFIARRNTDLLDHLLQVTMMRHTKAQDLALELPPRSYETIEVELSGSHRAIYCFVLSCCLQELALWAPQHTNPRTLRVLCRLVTTSCIAPWALNLAMLDLVRRSMWGRTVHDHGVTLSAGQNLILRTVSALEAIRFLGETRSGIVRNSYRQRAPIQDGSQSDLESLMAMDLKDLEALVKAKGLLPSTPVSRERLARLAAGGVHRLNGDSLTQLRQSVVEAGILPDHEVAEIPKNRALALLTKHYSLQASYAASDSIHEAGFIALTKLIEKNESPGCPVCLQPSIENISLTKCGHFYCVECLKLMFSSEMRGSVKCAICRRDVSSLGVVEVKRLDRHEGSTSSDEVVDHGVHADRGSPQRVNRQALTFVLRADSQRYAHAKRPTLTEVWTEYQNTSRSSRFSLIGRDPDCPSLDPEFMQHMAVVRASNRSSPKLYALRSLIRSCSEDVKFCVVADTLQSLSEIGAFLSANDIASTGVTSPGWGRNSIATGVATKRFAEDPKVRVFLLNTANAAGLTLTAAQYVVIMETMVRVADELQATARVHRIGQTRPVKIIRIVAKNTIEEQIIFRRGNDISSVDETNSLFREEGSETPVRDLIQLFRDLRPGEEFL